VCNWRISHFFPALHTIQPALTYYLSLSTLLNCTSCTQYCCIKMILWLLPRSSQRMLTKGRIACRAVIEDWTIPSTACCYWRLNDPFAAHTSAGTSNAFQWAIQPPKLTHTVMGPRPHLIHGFLGPREAAPQTASRSVQPFCRVHERHQQTDMQTDHTTLSVAMGCI